MLATTLVTVLLAQAAPASTPADDAWLPASEATLKAATAQLGCKGKLAAQKGACLAIVGHGSGTRPALAVGNHILLGKAWTLEPAGPNKVTVTAVDELQLLVLNRDAVASKGVGTNLAPQDDDERKQLEAFASSIEHLGATGGGDLVVNKDVQSAVKEVAKQADQPVEATRTGLKLKGAPTEIRQVGTAMTMVGKSGPKTVVGIFVPVRIDP